jgi:hypothetical protein
MEKRDAYRDEWKERDAARAKEIADGLQADQDAADAKQKALIGVVGSVAKAVPNPWVKAAAWGLEGVMALKAAWYDRKVFIPSFVEGTAFEKPLQAWKTYNDIQDNNDRETIRTSYLIDADRQANWERKYNKHFKYGLSPRVKRKRLKI